MGGRKFIDGGRRGRARAGGGVEERREECAPGALLPPISGMQIHILFGNFSPPMQKDLSLQEKSLAKAQSV